MGRLRHTLTQLSCALLLGGAACESSEPAADGGGYSKDTDAAIEPKTLKLCDGSDEIRLGYQSGGGFVDEGYGFEQRYGFQFLFVDGHCNFILARYEDDPPGGFVHGQLSEDAATELEQRLELASLPTGRYFDKESCPDAGSVSLATSQFYGDCSCGCDAGAPAGLERALSAMGGTLTFVRELGAAASGDVELAARSQSPLAASGARAWPFAWPVADIDNVTLSDPGVETRLRVLQGTDAQTARDLFSAARMGDRDKPVFVASDGAGYRVFLRDRIDPNLAEYIERFQREADPRLVRPIAACQGDSDESTTFGSAFLQRGRLFTWVESLPVCGPRICWDGEFQEKQPVVAPLRVVKAAKPRPCLGLPQTGFQLDLAPIVAAYRAGYPGAKVEIDLSLPGWSGETLRLTE